MYTWLVDLDALPVLPRYLRPLARFDTRDHLGDPNLSIRDNLTYWLTASGVSLSGGTVLMLAHPRMFGYVFNPITLYWCYRPDGALACVVAEVHNTYHQAHRYVLRPNGSGYAETTKEFFVSPFLPSTGHYRMWLTEPGEYLSITIELRDQRGTLLTATMAGTRAPYTQFGLVRRVLRHPFVPQRVSALIRRHGIALWLRNGIARRRPRKDFDCSPTTNRDPFEAREQPR
ncbi:hypothetical protein EV191_11959 [Tamaricihabitans halophyticus]|uniref:DUF1365 family protein n=2 Tax=Tamaricihabitans halophyticus TaxID=1262583 RepID=A0A4R2Q9G9_9PSEU|nr:hypothetical protein EV191_11959 [Tamaricihabitans halophyticus]